MVQEMLRVTDTLTRCGVAGSAVAQAISEVASGALVTTITETGVEPIEIAYEPLMAGNVTLNRKSEPVDPAGMTENMSDALNEAAAAGLEIRHGSRVHCSPLAVIGSANDIGHMVHAGLPLTRGDTTQAMVRPVPVLLFPLDGADASESIRIEVASQANEDVESGAAIASKAKF